MLTLSCSSHKIEYFHGYIYSTNKQPLSGLKVVGQYTTKPSSVSDTNGYFKIRNVEDIKGRYLYVLSKEKKIDSIFIVSTHPERGPSYYFVNGRKDTLFINVDALDLE